MRGFKRAAVAAQVVVGLMSAGVANADIWDTPGAFASYQLIPEPHSPVVTQYGTDWLYGEGVTDFYLGSDMSGGAGRGSVAARGAVGWAQAGANASGTGYGVSAWGGWTDQISVNVAGQTGQHGTLQFSLSYDWVTPSSMSSMVNETSGGRGWATNYADALLKVVGAPNKTAQYLWAEQTTSSSCGAIGQCYKDVQWNAWQGTGIAAGESLAIGDGVLTYTFDVVFGEQYFLTIGMNASIFGEYGSGATNPSSSISWAGLTSVRDSNGQLIDKTSVSMGSALGFDFNQAVTAVPEPQSALLLLAGLGMLAGLRRRLR